MPTTPRAGLRYPGLLDAPHGPLGLQYLAEDVDAALYRAFPCSSTTRPAAPPVNMIIRESDTGAVLIWTGSAWQNLTEQGGAGAATADVQYSAASAQSIPNATDRVVAFGLEQTASPLVERSVYSSGHSFELQASGLWACSATVRYPQIGADGERYAGLYSTAAPTEPIMSGGSGDDDAPCTISWSCTRRFVAGTTLFVVARQSTGGARSLQPGVNGSWVRLNLALVG